MELIEAIYLSLAVFSVGVIVLLVISFTSYKVKKKLGTNENNTQTSHELKPKLETKNGQPIQKKTPHSNPVVKKEKIKITDKKREVHSSSATKSKFAPKPKKNIITKTGQPRIEVLNKPVKETSPTKEQSKITSIENSSNKNANANILDHYSDSQDDDFKSITE